MSRYRDRLPQLSGELFISDADMIAAITMNYVEEAIGIARAAQAAGMPSAISFTVETDGRLPAGETIKEAENGAKAVAAFAPRVYPCWWMGGRS